MFLLLSIGWTHTNTAHGRTPQNIITNIPYTMIYKRKHTAVNMLSHDLNSNGLPKSCDLSKSQAFEVMWSHEITWVPEVMWSYELLKSYMISRTEQLHVLTMRWPKVIHTHATQNCEFWSLVTAVKPRHCTCMCTHCNKSGVPRFIVTFTPQTQKIIRFWNYILTRTA